MTGTICANCELNLRLALAYIVHKVQFLELAPVI